MVYKCLSRQKLSIDTQIVAKRLYLKKWIRIKNKKIKIIIIIKKKKKKFSIKPGRNLDVRPSVRNAASIF